MQTLNQDRDPESAVRRYSELYEESVNPFAVFHRKERTRQFNNLPTHEKVTLRGAQFFLESKASRTFLFVYSLGLHLLVMATLYKVALDSPEAHGIVCK
jgi:homeobox protein cut-like